MQGVERLASVLILPHPKRDASEVRRRQPHPEREMTARRVVIEYEENRGCVVTDVHKKQEPILDPARFPWHEVRKVQHYYLTVDTLKKPMSVREGTRRGRDG